MKVWVCRRADDGADSFYVAYLIKPSASNIGFIELADYIMCADEFHKMADFQLGLGEGPIRAEVSIRRVRK